MDAMRYPLTHPQKRVWYTEQVYPGTSLHNITGSIRIEGPLDYPLLAQAIEEQKRLHETLRLRVAEADCIPVQFVIPYDEQEKDEPFVDFSASAHPEEEWLRWVETEAARPFSLDEGPLCSFPMFRINEQVGGFLVKIHHIASDGWSSTMLIDRIRDAYERLSRGEALLDSAVPSYLDYLEREAAYLASARLERDKQFWIRTFADWPREEMTPLSSDSLEGTRKVYVLDAARSAAAKALLTETGCTLTALFHLLVSLYIRKTEGRSDTVVGMPVFNRSGPKEKATVGMFTSTIPIRFAIDGEASVLDELVRMQRELSTSYYHQKYPYDLLASDLQLKKRGIDRLFDVSVNVYNTKVITDWQGNRAEVVEHHGGSQLYALQIVIKDWSASGQLTIEIDYKPAEHTEEQIDQLYNRLTVLIDSLIAAPKAPVGQLSMLSSEQKERLAAYLSTLEHYPKDKTIVQLFVEQAERTPKRIAAVFGQEQLTYGQLDERSERLAAWLASQGVGLEQAVGLLIRHSLDTVVAIMAVLRAGAAYVPIDPEYPPERISYMLEDADCALLFMNVPLPEGGYGYTGPIVRLDDPRLYQSESADDAARIRPASPHNLAYMIYTSGSTGKPKGVMIEHLGLVNYIWWAKAQYTHGEDEVFPLYTSLAFDLTVTTVFTPLLTGGRIDIYRDDQEEYVLERIMNDNQATVIKLTPSHLSLLKDRNNQGSSVRRLIVGGEDLRTDLAKRVYDSFGGQIDICNEYGPTETVVGCMIHRYDPKQDSRVSVPIGVPGANVGIHLLDVDRYPVPAGVLGEIYITGDGLARGYRNLPSVSEERFVPCPFLPGERMYRTGDLARRLESGAVEYAGRADMQVKIRGHRIELGEIEKALIDHSSVREAVVIDRPSIGGSKQLVAYVVRDVEQSDNLIDYLNGRLPAYMVPAHVVELERIPLNVNGKVDRSRLPEPALRYAGSPEDRHRTRQTTPATAVLLAVASEVLQADGLTEDDHFYSWGGDSIKAIQLASRLRTRGYAIKVSDVLVHTRFGDMAGSMKTIGYTANDVIDTRCEGEQRLTPITDWFMTRPFQERHHYVQSVLLRLDGPLSAIQLEAIVRKLVERHDTFRLNIHPSTGALFYNSRAAVERVEMYQLSDVGGHERNERIQSIGEQLKASFQLEQDALLKACLFDLGPDGCSVLLVAHHLAVDAVSWSILLEEFGLLYESLQDIELMSLPTTVPLPAVTTSYQRWADHLWSRAEESEHERSYWQSVIEDECYIRCDGDDRSTPGNVRTVTEWLTYDLTEQLLKRAITTYGTNVQELLASSLATAIRDVFRIEQPVIELEGHGREPADSSIDLSRTVGWFTSMYPARVQAAGGGSWEACVKSVKETIRHIPSKGIGFGLLTRLTRTMADPGEGKRIRFNYVGELDSSLGRRNLLTLSEESTGADSGTGNPATSPLDIVAMVIGGRLQLSISFEQSTIRSETAADFAGCFAKRTEELIRHCCSVRVRAYTPSDFATISLSQEALDSLYL